MLAYVIQAGSPNYGCLYLNRLRNVNGSFQKVRYLSSANLALEAWGILGSPVVFTLCCKIKEAGFQRRMTAEVVAIEQT